MMESKFGATVLDMVDGMLKKDKLLQLKTARSLESLVGSESIPSNLEFITSLFCALTYDIVNDPFNAKRMYQTLFDRKQIDLSPILLSSKNSTKLLDGLAHLGMREHYQFTKNFGEILENIRLKENAIGQVIEEEFKDDYVVLVSLCALLDKFFAASEKLNKDELHTVFTLANKFSEDLVKFEPKPWLEILSNLYLELIKSVNERSIVNLKIVERAKKQLWNSRFRELWPPQVLAMERGLFEGNNIVYSSPTGTGKSFLAYLSLGKLEEDKQIAYLVPTKSLSSQVYDDVKRIFGQTYRFAISDRDRTSDDDYLADIDFIVTTYEKMDALLRREQINLGNLQTIIVDELQYLGDKQRGLDLEFLLTRLRVTEPQKPQLIALSALTSKSDTLELAEWLNAETVISNWKAIDVDEAIYLDGYLHYKTKQSIRLPSAFHPSKSLTRGKTREIACSQFARRAILEKEPILVSVMKRTEASDLAKKIKQQFAGAYFDSDLQESLEKQLPDYEKVVNTIKLIEVELPPFANELIELLRSGIAYHHAGLPMKYRSAIELAVKKRQVKVLIATTTLEAGINLPFKTVVFFDPKINYGGTWHYLETRSYRNIAGRSGRPGHNEKGEAIVLSVTDSEYEKYQRIFWYADLEPIHSSFYDVLNEEKIAKATLQSQLLALTVTDNLNNKESIVNHLTSTWFWRKAKPQHKDKLTELVSDEITTLEREGYIKTENQIIIPTDLGKKINKSMFLPITASYLTKCLEYLNKSNFDQKKETNFILILAGLPIEVSENYKNFVKNISIPTEIASFEEDFKKIDELQIDKEQLELAFKFSSLLYYWINSVTTTEILDYCKLDSLSYTAIIEDGISKDAFWVLSTVASIAEGFEEVRENLIEKIREVAEFCKLGASDINTIQLLKTEAEHMGRSTAIKLVRASQMMNKDPYSLTKDEFLGIFNSNPETAALLFEELQENNIV